MKLLAWNIRHGGGSKRMPHIALTLLEHAADVVVLTEFRRTTGGQIAGVLADHGLEHQACSDPPPGKNGLLVASRAPIQVQPGLTHRWAEIVLPDSGLRILAVHAPHDTPGQASASTARTRFFQAVVDKGRAHVTDPFIMLGDFNEWTRGPATRVLTAGREQGDEEGSTLACTYRLGVLASLGYIDAWRRFNPAGREFTWYSPQGGGFRIDHVFVSPPLRDSVEFCRYSHAERESGLSDHSVVVMGLR